MPPYPVIVLARIFVVLGLLFLATLATTGAYFCFSLFGVPFPEAWTGAIAVACLVGIAAFAVA